MHAMVNKSNNAAPPATPPMIAFVLMSVSPDDLDLCGGASAFAGDFPDGERGGGGGGLREFVLDDEGGGGDFLFPLLLFPFDGGGGGGGDGDDDDEESVFGGGAELESEDIFKAICPDMVY